MPDFADESSVLRYYYLTLLFTARLVSVLVSGPLQGAETHPQWEAPNNSTRGQDGSDSSRGSRSDSVDGSARPARMALMISRADRGETFAEGRFVAFAG